MSSVFRYARASAARLVAAGACVLLAACGDAESAGGESDDPAVAPQILRGELEPGEGWLFRACDANTELPLRPADMVISNLLDELGAPGEKLYVELEGRVGGRVPTMTMTRLHYAAIDTLGCAAVQMDAEFRAQGNEPFWSLAVEAEHAIWRTPERLDGLGFAITERENVGEGLLLSGVTETQALEVAFAATACRDTMADAWYGYTVQVQIDDEIYYGCGRRGGAR